MQRERQYWLVRKAGQEVPAGMSVLRVPQDVRSDGDAARIFRARTAPFRGVYQVIEVSWPETGHAPTQAVTVLQRPVDEWSR